ncbi:tetratricopeptide repeat protein [Sandarakinorhabdus sp. DWP1-3-1]|uniref:tetratricopeptide repeat protein n=1 Tax=Sandarakinorhabdus sp. DWP1-3-1 TaxID=2804627 RepID=UPI003CFB08EC
MKFIAVLLLCAAGPAIAAPMASDRSRYNACLAQVKADPGRAIAIAQGWRIENGGVPALHCQALAEAARRDWPAALKSFERAARASEQAADGQAGTIWGQAGATAMLAGQPAAALVYIDTAIPLAGGGAAEAQLRVDRAEALVDLKRDKEAVADLETAVKLDPRVEWGWLLKATLARRMGDFKTAEAAILEAAEQTPDSAEVQFEAGNIAAAQGNAELARTAWAAAVAVDPESTAGKAAQAALTGG